MGENKFVNLFSLIIICIDLIKDILDYVFFFCFSFVFVRFVLLGMLGWVVFYCYFYFDICYLCFIILYYC